MYRTWIKARTKCKSLLYFSQLTHQYWFTNINIKVECGTGGKMFIHNPKQENQLLKPGTPLLIICSSVCKSYIKEVHDNLSNPCSKRKTRDGNILGRWINAETVPKTFIIPHKVNTVNIGYWTTSSWKGRLPYAISSNQSCHKSQPILWNIATYWALCYSSCW